MSFSAPRPDQPPAADRQPLGGPVVLVTLLTLLTLWRVASIITGDLNLSFDEAQYWLWSRDPAFGYFSKPPVVAWVIALTTALFGDAEWAVKLGAPVANAMTAGLIYVLGCRLYDHRVGFWAAIVFCTIPGIAYSSMVVTVDPFLLLFWAAGLIALHAALDAETDAQAKAWWLALGLCIGFGLLAKYAMLFFVACAALYIGLHPMHRRKAFSLGPWLALALGAALYLPNFLWNAAHGFLTYAHTRSNANVTEFALHPDKMGEFLASQFGVFGPLTFAVALWLMVRAAKTAREDERQGFLLAFMLPVLALMTAQSLLSRANANWAAPVYVAGSLAVVAWLAARGRWWVVRASVVLHVALAAAFYNFETVMPLVGQDLTSRNDPAKRIRGWERLGGKLAEIRALHPGKRLLFDARKVMAPLLYYISPSPFDSVMWNPDRDVTNHYEMAFDMAAAVGEDFLLVTEEPDAHHIVPWFNDVIEVGVVTIPIYEDFALTTRVYLARGFKGYDTPPSP